MFGVSYYLVIPNGVEWICGKYHDGYNDWTLGYLNQGIELIGLPNSVKVITGTAFTESNFKRL